MLDLSFVGPFEIVVSAKNIATGANHEPALRLNRHMCERIISLNDAKTW